ncbi:21830_t:CDS:2, partial [Gigaspora rosea]
NIPVVSAGDDIVDFEGNFLPDLGSKHRNDDNNEKSIEEIRESNVNMGGQTEKANIPGAECDNGAREMDGIVNTLIQEESKEGFDIGARYQGDDSGSRMKKGLNDSKLIDVDIETRKTVFNEYNIPAVSDISRHDEFMVERRCDKEFDRSGCEMDEFTEEAAKPPDGRAIIDSIGMRNVKEIRDENIRYTYHHEYESPDEIFRRDGHFAGNDEAARVIERDKMGIINMRIKVDKFEYNEIKGRGEKKIDGVNDWIKKSVEDDPVDNKEIVVLL